MEDPEEIEPSKKKSEMEGYHDFKKNDFSIQIEEEKEGKQTFYVKSEDFFQRVGKAIKNVINNIKFKFKKVFSKKNTEEQHYKISKKLYNRQRRLEKKLKKIEHLLDKTQELAGQINDDTSQIIVDIETVAVVLEYQMDRISDKMDEVEKYMKDHLGSDWHRIKTNWKQYKDGEITRGEFTRSALKKLGKSFLNIFVKTS
jgi:methyl-accepting chemotaxis protein